MSANSVTASRLRQLGVESADVSTGSSDAAKIPLLGSDGRLDPSLLRPFIVLDADPIDSDPQWQSVDFNGTLTGGTFTITVNGVTSAPIPVLLSAYAGEPEAITNLISEVMALYPDKEFISEEWYLQFSTGKMSYFAWMFADEDAHEIATIDITNVTGTDVAIVPDGNTPIEAVPNATPIGQVVLYPFSGYLRMAYNASAYAGLAKWRYFSSSPV